MNLMKKMKKNDIDLIKTLCSMNDLELIFCLRDFLREVGYRDVTATGEYVIAEGDIPICLIAHCDTVFQFTPIEWYFDSQKRVLWSPDGAGFDDRAGIFIILKLLQAGYKPHVIFTTGEEIGGVGAFSLVSQFKECPFRNKPKCLIELDRMGENDCVFYDCCNKKFIKTIQNYGFKLAYGTFTDISIIAPAWGIAAVNLSVGYYDEHTTIERLFIDETYKTLKRIAHILDDVNKLDFYKFVRRRHWKVRSQNIPMRSKNNSPFCFWCNEPIEGNPHYFNAPSFGLNASTPLCDSCAKYVLDK